MGHWTREKQPGGVHDLQLPAHDDFTLRSVQRQNMTMQFTSVPACRILTDKDGRIKHTESQEKSVFCVL